MFNFSRGGDVRSSVNCFCCRNWSNVVSETGWFTVNIPFNKLFQKNGQKMSDAKWKGQENWRGDCLVRLTCILAERAVISFFRGRGGRGFD